MFPGIGTVVNVATVLLGSVIGVLVGHRLSQRTRDVVTDALGLVTLLIAASSAASVADRAWSHAVGDSAPTLIVLEATGGYEARVAASSARCSGSSSASRRSAAGSRPPCSGGRAAAPVAPTGNGSSKGS